MKASQAQPGPMPGFRETAHDDGTYGTARRRCLDLVISRGFIARVNIRTMVMPLIPDTAASRRGSPPFRSQPTRPARQCARPVILVLHSKVDSS
jgi:hypothetical protein